MNNLATSPVEHVRSKLSFHVSKGHYRNMYITLIHGDELGSKDPHSVSIVTVDENDSSEYFNLRDELVIVQMSCQNLIRTNHS